MNHRVSPKAGARRTHAERSAATRQHLIATAIDVIQHRSLEEMSIHELAKSAGMTSGAVQHHFESKAVLMMNVLSELIESTVRSGELWPSPALSARERAVKFVQAVWRLVYAQPRFIVAWNIYLGCRNQPEVLGHIAELRQSADLSTLPVGRRVVVIGGGMTAVDAAVQSRKLGAEEVTIVYRRGAEAMSASAVEQQWAQTNGVTIRHWAAPKEVLSEGGAVQGVRFAATALSGGKLVETGETFTLAADMVLKAIGQTFVAEPVGKGIALEGGRIVTDAEGQTRLARVWAGGDCRVGGRDLTVEAVEHGKVAAVSIHAALTA